MKLFRKRETTKAVLLRILQRVGHPAEGWADLPACDLEEELVALFDLISEQRDYAAQQYAKAMAPDESKQKKTFQTFGKS